MKDGPPPLAAELYGDLLDVTPGGRLGWRSYVPGLAMAGIASLAAAYLSEHYGAPLMLMGLLIGLAFNFINADARLHPGLGFASKTLLRWGIVLVGLQVTFAQIASLGWAALAAIIGIMFVVVASGAAASRVIGRDAAFGTLAGGAVAVCGASAALAFAAVLGERRASQAQLTLVLVGVSAASALAMSTYPLIAHALSLSDKQAGFLMGASIHDVAQALGAGYSHSQEAGLTATIVKLTRVALLAPALALVALAFPPMEGQARTRIGVPSFVIAFLALVAAQSLIDVPIEVDVWARNISSALLLFAVTATGIRSPMQQLLDQGWRVSVPVIVATIVSFALALLAAVMLVQ